MNLKDSNLLGFDFLKKLLTFLIDKSGSFESKIKKISFELDIFFKGKLLIKSLPK